MMENFPNFLSTSSSSSSLSLQQILFSRASDHRGHHFRHPPSVSDGFPMLFRDVSTDDMSFDATSSVKDEDNNNNNNNVVSVSERFRVDGSSALKKAEEEGEVRAGAMMGERGGGDCDKKKKMRSRRFAFQTRSQVDILDDGYRWRKYGQKAVKNNKFPRSYYRCTHQGCKVKKQVQRLTRDEGVVVTTYEGIHSHPIEKSTDNFEHILSQMQIYTSY
ncbi:hypothetical protein IC582_017274 [Cucumis melo]|uniref:Probable WRKY transcription factor 24 n=1 Tax=Cucumis melo TaxID=3656 RepID=A0A1S3BYF2_CUCME|nr:probable WRKY transcription factor 24 [Cucumis melo]